MNAGNGIYARHIKRCLDFMVSSAILVLLSPFLAVVALLIKLDSPGSIIYRQARPGKDQVVFDIYKFRTMRMGADRCQKVGVEVMKDDARITPLGRLLRRFKIDELAQLVNVMKGDMSLVGPRPTLPEYLDRYEEWEKKRFSVRPGLTGLAQVNGNIYLTREEKSRYDVTYAEHVSLWSDIRIILKTVAIVLLGEEKFIRKKGNGE